MMAALLDRFRLRLPGIIGRRMRCWLGNFHAPRRADRAFRAEYEPITGGKLGVGQHMRPLVVRANSRVASGCARVVKNPPTTHRHSDARTRGNPALRAHHASVIERKAERFDQVQLTTGIGGQMNDIARIGRNFRTVTRTMWNMMCCAKTVKRYFKALATSACGQSTHYPPAARRIVSMYARFHAASRPW